MGCLPAANVPRLARGGGPAAALAACAPRVGAAASRRMVASTLAQSRATPVPCSQRHAEQLHPQQQHPAQQRRRRRARCAASAAGAAGGGAGGVAGLDRALAAAAAFAQAQFLPLALVTAIAVGCACPAAGVAVGQLPGLTAFVTTSMFVLSGLQLRQGEAAQALKASGAVASGLGRGAGLRPRLQPSIWGRRLPPLCRGPSLNVPLRPNPRTPAPAQPPQPHPPCPPSF
jgi:hypothetical protein